MLNWQMENTADMREKQLLTKDNAVSSYYLRRAIQPATIHNHATHYCI